MDLLTTTTTTRPINSATTTLYSNATDDYDDFYNDYKHGENSLNAPNAQQSLDDYNNDSAVSPLLHGILEHCDSIGTCTRANLVKTI